MRMPDQNLIHHPGASAKSRPSRSKMGTRRIIAVFRNDDPSALMDLEHERRIFELFEHYGVPQTLAVIPRVTRGRMRDPQPCGEAPLLPDSPATRFLLAHIHRTGAEIALHGLTHRTHARSQPARREFFEFRQLSAEEQLNRLQQGIEILQQALGAKPVTFVPPWNRLDDNTISACAQVGLRIVSAGPHTKVSDDMIAFGCNTSIADFAAMFARAKAGKELTFLHVLFHSRTVVTDDERNKLEECLRLVTQDSECQAMTIAQAVETFPTQIRIFNEAGKAAVHGYQLPGSKRARSHIYHRPLALLGYDVETGADAKRAKAFYNEGLYAKCCAALKAMEQQSGRMVIAVRGVIAFLGVVVGASLHAAASFLSIPPIQWLSGGPPLICAVGGFLGLRVIAPDSRREIFIVSMLLAIGFAAGLLVRIASFIP